MSYFSKILKDNEELIKLVKRHPFTFFGQAFLSLIFFLLPFFLMVLLLAWKLIGLIIFCLLLLIGLLMIIRLLVVSYYNCLMITNQRVILFKQRGLFDRQVSEIEYQKIQDVSYHFKGLWQTLFHYGSLKIQVLSSETIIKPEKIFHPEKVQDLIKNIQRNQLLDNTVSAKPKPSLKSKSDDLKIGVDSIFKR